MRRFWRKPDEPTTFRLGFASGFFFFASLIGVVSYVGSVVVAWRAAELEAPRTVGAPLRAPDGIFLLTTQYETRVAGGGSRWSAYRGLEKVTHVDAWRLDAISAQPVWRKRLSTESGGSTLELALLGADGDRLWIFRREPLALSIEKGEVLAGAAAIEARNPALRGVLPKAVGHYRFFDGHGLALTAADARAWLLDAQTLAAVPWVGKGAVAREGAVGPAYYAPSNTKSFQLRGLTLPNNWLGVLTDDEAAAIQPKPLGENAGAMAHFRESMRAPLDLAHTGPNRYRFWQAKVEQVSAAPHGWPKSLPDKWGKRPYYSSFTPFEKSPEFLQAGLLGDGRSKLPIMLKAPDSVLILHRDRIDDEGRLHVSRMAGPDGRRLWDAALPLSILQSVMPGEKSLVLFGRAYPTPLPRVGDPYHAAEEWIVALDPADGAIRTFNLSRADEKR